MWRLKERDRISSRQLANIEQAYYMCRPAQYRPGRAANMRESKEQLSVIQQFIRHILHTLLSRDSLPRLCELLQLVPWDQEGDFILDEFTSLISQVAKFSDI